MAKVFPIDRKPEKKKRHRPVSVTLPRDLEDRFENTWPWATGKPFFHVNKSQFITEALRRYIEYVEAEENDGKPFRAPPKNFPGAKRGAPSRG